MGGNSTLDMFFCIRTVYQKKLSPKGMFMLILGVTHIARHDLGQLFGLSESLTGKFSEDEKQVVGIKCHFKFRLDCRGASAWTRLVWKSGSLKEKSSRLKIETNLKIL